MVRRKLISYAEYDRLLNIQGGGCALCGRFGTERDLAVDHDHITGEIRGLLCSGCNTAIGRLGDNVAGLERAIDYLEGNLEPDPERVAEWNKLRGRA